MRREDLKKRLVKVIGVPLISLTNPRTEGRRTLAKIAPESEEEKFSSFFDFEDELAGVESARKQFERMEVDRMEREKAVDFQPTEEAFITFEEEAQPIPPKEPPSRLCEGTRNDGNACKSLRVRGSRYCKAHGG